VIWVVSFLTFLVGSKDNIATDNCIVTTDILYCRVYEEGMWFDLYLLETI